MQINHIVKGASVAALLAATTAVLAQSADHEHRTTVTSPAELKWVAPAAYAAGMQLAVVNGDPSKPGMYVVRLKLPAGYVIPAHMHPNDENVTVLSGSFNIGTGPTLDKSKGTSVKAGGYSFVGKGMAHYAWFTEDTVLQLHGVGPQGITYVNPADDPRKQ